MITADYLTHRGERPSLERLRAAEWVCAECLRLVPEAFTFLPRETNGKAVTTLGACHCCEFEWCVVFVGSVIRDVRR